MLPAFLIVILISSLVKKVVQNELAQSALDGLKACMAGVILATGAYMILTNCIGSVQTVSVDAAAVVMTAVLALLYFGARKVLNAAAMTYVASAAATILQVLRLVLIFGGGRRRR